jgi:adenylate kinase
MIDVRLILLGPPGAGKGTQASAIVKKYRIPHISTGDIFRDNIKRGTDLGEKAKSYMDKGLLVPDKLVISIVEDRLLEEDCKNGFLLDGFPRTLNQSEVLDKVLLQMGLELNKVINLHVDKEILIERAIGRRICKNCGEVYHIKFTPPTKEGICDKCGGELYQRDDDTVETVEKRIEVYRKQTEPLIDYYEEKGLLLDIDGSKDKNLLFEEIINALEM